MKTMKKTAIVKIAMAAVLILFALSFVTCEDLMESIIPQQAKDEIELDWQYEDLPNGMGRLTLMLDGSKPFVHKQQRGLNVDIAKMTHDYFEAVFISAADLDDLATTGADGVVARTNWEIGMPAGVAGLARDIDYGAVFPADGGAASVVFVGKKQGKTLLGIGQLVQVNEGAAVVYNTAGDNTSGNSTFITSNATSVIYGVYPMHTKVGFENVTGLPTWEEATFITAVDRPVPTGSANLVNPADSAGGKTAGKILSLPGNVSYPLFELPSAVNNRTIAARYTIGGLSGGGATITGGPLKLNLWDAARVLTTQVGGVTYGLEIIKRYAAYQVQGQTFDASKALDTYTAVDIAPPVLPATVPKNQTTHGPFQNVIDMVLTQKTQSTGIFAITFQCPVYAITQASATNASGTDSEKWYIRPGSNQYQYLLDSGEDAGGMVMLGIDTAGVVDWLEIFTVGIGFVNN